jgi:hypothetical protein
VIRESITKGCLSALTDKPYGSNECSLVSAPVLRRRVAQQAFVRDMTPKNLTAETAVSGRRLFRSVEILGESGRPIMVLRLPAF